MHKYLLIFVISIALNGCVLSNKTANKVPHENTYVAVNHFTAKMIKEVRARRARYLKSRKH